MTKVSTFRRHANEVGKETNNNDDIVYFSFIHFDLSRELYASIFFRFFFFC